MPLMSTQVTLDPASPSFDSTDLAASALADKFGGDTKAALETAGVILHGPDGKYRYSTSVGGRDDSFQLAAQIPKGHTLAAIVHTHPGKDVAGQVFSPNDLKMAEQLKLPSYVRFLNDGSTRMYQPGKTATQSMASGRFRIKVAKGDPLAPNTGLMAQATQATPVTTTQPTGGLLAP